MRGRDRRALRRASRRPSPTGRVLSAEERVRVIERLHDEFDLLCLGPPTAWRIELELRLAEGGP